MRDIPVELRTESIRLGPTGAFLFLIELYISPTQTVYLTGNTAGVTFDGHDYKGFAFEYSVTYDDSTGNISAAQLSMSGINEELKELWRLNRGFADMSLRIRQVHSAYLADPDVHDSWYFKVMGSEKNETNIVCSLGGEDFFSAVILFDKVRRDTCGNKYQPINPPSPYACGYLSQTAFVANATNATPIVITQLESHGMRTGQVGVVASVGGNTAANGTWTVTVINAKSYSLNGSVGNGAYTSGGTITYTLPTCDHTLNGSNGCAAHQNSLRFRGVPGAQFL